MQRYRGIYRLLKSGWIYNAFQYLVGSRKAQRWAADTIWRCSGGERVIDMGCGTGDTLDYLPANINYTGFDINENYIQAARQRFGDRAQFLTGTAHDFLSDAASSLNMSDLILSNGLLHHLDDGAALEALRLAKKNLVPAGRLVCIEPAFLVLQTWLSKWMTGKDRGQNVRSEQEWKDLTGQVFSSFSTNIITGLFRLPYAHIVIECRAEGQA